VTAARIVALPGDGVGPEVTRVALEVLRAAGARFGRTFEVEERPVGWAAVEAGGDPLPAATETRCLEADAVLLGAVGSPDAEGAPAARRPEAGLLRLRKALGCFANLRPVRLPDALVDASPLKGEIVRGTDFVIVRELAGGLYYGEPRSEGTADAPAVNTLRYGEAEVERVARVAFETARVRAGRLVSVDKANVLETSRRRVVTRTAGDYPDVRVEHVLVDRMAMELVLRPTRFDVILTENVFGDVLSDEGAGLVGSLGLLPSASLGGRTDLYEPVHGSAPDIAGTGSANPVGAVLSVGLMLRHTFGMTEAAEAVEAAVDRVLAMGHRTPDLAGSAPATEPVDTRRFGDLLVEAVEGGVGR